MFSSNLFATDFSVIASYKIIFQEQYLENVSYLDRKSVKQVGIIHKNKVGNVTE